jgi:hypothetical protein
VQQDALYKDYSTFFIQPSHKYFPVNSFIPSNSAVGLHVGPALCGSMLAVFGISQ